MSAFDHVLLTDEQLKARARRLIKASETPVRSVGMGGSSVALAPVNISEQIQDVLREMHNRGIADLTDYLQTESKLHSVDPAYAYQGLANLIS